jgi:hypothetical protein
MPVETRKAELRGAPRRWRCRWRQGRVITRRQLITPDLIGRQLARL